MKELDERFKHNSGFMAVYNSFESALNHAKELV